jgi:phosphonate transport system substrate-binding protein
MKQLIVSILILFSFSFSLGAQEKQAITLSFGIYQSDKASEMHRKFKPLLDYLSSEMSLLSKQSVVINLTIFKTYQQANDALVNGDIDFARFGPASYILAKQRQPKLQLLAMEEKKGQTRFYGLIIVQKEASFQTLADLKDASFAFGNQNSTIGRYLAQSELLNAGINNKALSQSEYLGRHDKVFTAVELGDFDAGSLKESTFKKLNKHDQLRVLHRFENITKPWIARAGLEANLYASLSEALTGLMDKALLKQYKVSAFVKSSDAEYQYVREGMLKSGKF